MIRITVDNHKQLIRYYHSGKIYKSDLQEAWDKLLNQKEFKDYDLLIDYRDAKFKFEVNEINNFKVFLDSARHILSGKKNAILTNNPFTIATILLIYSRVEIKGFSVNIFSTENPALNWLTEKERNTDSQLNWAY
jgi:hypothetical protein